MYITRFTSRRVAFLLLALSTLAFAVGRTSGQNGPEATELFATSDRCQACHNRLVAKNGEDLSIGVSWRTTMMGHSARDPYWRAGVLGLSDPAAWAASVVVMRQFGYIDTDLDPETLYSNKFVSTP